MTYAHIVNGTVDRIGLPRTGTLADGCTVSGFDALPAATLQAEGWLPLDDPGPPEHDPTTQQVVRSYDVLQTKVNVVYTVENLPEPPPPGPVEQARAIRDARSAAVAQPTAALLDAVEARLAALRAGETHTSQDWVIVYEALRQLGLKGVVDEAVATGSEEYAAIYTAHVDQS